MRLVSLLAFVGLASGCSDGGDGGMFVLSNTAPPVGTTCTFTGDPSQLSQSAGTISWYATELGQGYLLSPLIESRITTTNDDQIPQRTIHLEGANITATAQPAGTNQKYTALFAGSIAPGGTANVSFEALPGVVDQWPLIRRCDRERARRARCPDLRDARWLADRCRSFSVPGHDHRQGERASCSGPVRPRLRVRSAPIKRPSPARVTRVTPTQDGVVDCCTSMARASRNVSLLICPGA